MEDKRQRLRQHALASAVAALCAGLCAGAAAFEINTGNDDVEMRWDNTVRYNLGRRVQSQDPAILRNIGADDGDRNFGNNSIVNNRVDLLSEFDVVYRKQIGARVSAAGWYDDAYAGGFDNTSLATSNHLDNGRPAFGISDYAKRYYRGPSGEILDAFVFGNFNLGDAPTSVRAGQHTVNWGEALLGGGAIHGVTYAQAPLDQAKAFASPGIEAKELYRPLNQLSGTLQATPELSFAAQYFLDWQATRAPEGGTYLGFNDALQFGGESLFLAPGVRALRGPDIRPKDSGDWGLASRWSPQWLDGTAGLYVRNFSDRLPQVIVKTTGVRQYFLAYGGDVDLYGVSLAKQIAGISFGFDLNYRRNMPLVSDAVSVTSVAALPKPGDLLGARGNTSHGVLNALGSLGSTPLFNSATWAAELTWNRWNSVTQGAAYFKGRDNYTAIDKVSRDYFGLAFNFSPTWYQVFPGGDLSMPMSYSRGLSGNSAVTFGGNEGAGSWSAGFALDLYSKYRFELKYVGYFGDYVTGPTGAVTVANGSTALLKDRGAVFFTFKTTL
ncbi:DUF1302 domain-containing protein [Variovorax sp. Sphag1AA]|uniref:DUF1302 domain-containing protein n=1 Tax=Variovorax sp. Sphag1AA TaxID=2587027 RepID=UPI00161F95E9|nr:DUF1302 domain-containing protein [Variovorax sp. Sphag1AA]MBB3178491.1 hypothetical protein [Variovorax sp. Sphag1AA]